MARIRTIKPEFWDDPDLAGIPPYGRLLFIGLWQQADREGRLVEDVRRLRARIFPFEPEVDVAGLLSALERGRFIRRYQVNGQALLLVRNFCRHQQPHLREPASTIPAPLEAGPEAVERAADPVPEPVEHRADPVLAPVEHRADPVLAPVEHRADPVPAPVEHDPAPIGREGKDLGRERSRSRSRARGSRACPTTDEPEGFGVFWGAYPRKVGKGAALRVWRRLQPSAALVARMRAAIAAQRRSRQWLDEGGRFVPNPATWLNQERWDDEPETGGPELGGSEGEPESEAWVCVHEPHCGSRSTCERRVALEDMKAALRAGAA